MGNYCKILKIIKLKKFLFSFKRGPINMSLDNQATDTGIYTKYIKEKITEVSQKCGPRAAGSDGDKKARKYFIRDTEEVCDETTVEEFRCSDKAFMSWVSVGAVTMIVAIALFV